MTNSNLKQDELGLQRAAHRGLALADEHVDLGAYAERARVDARFNGKPGAGNQAALVVRFVVIHVHAIAVHLGAEAVAGPVDELAAEAALVEQIAAGAIDLVAADLAAVLHARLD